MAKSMTGFGRATRIVGGREISTEIKSVNSKYIDFNIKVPKNYGAFESKIKSHVESRGIARGKIDIYLSINDIESSSVSVGLDKAYLASYLEALNKLKNDYSLKDDISVMTVAKNPLVFTTVSEEIDLESVWNDVKGVLDEALDAFISVREAEGKRLASDLLSKKDELEKLRIRLLERSKQYVPQYRARLEERLREVLSDNTVKADESRILTECAIFADKTAIDEELVRLSCHMKAFEDLFASNDPIGRKLDFLLQEIGREINTSGSKCSDSESTAIVVDMKCLAEKIREQIQNLE